MSNRKAKAAWYDKDKTKRRWQTYHQTDTAVKARGLSQKKLSFKAGMHRTSLGGIERGERNPALRNIASIAKALGVTLPDFFNLITEVNNNRISRCFRLFVFNY